MNHVIFQNAEWCQAITLKEHIASWNAAQSTSPKIAMNADLALRRMDCWKSQPPFDNDSYFEKRLATEGMSEEEFLYILGEPIAAVRNGFPDPPDWLIALEQAFSSEAEPEPITMPEELKEIQTIDFLHLIEPLMHQGRDHLHGGIETLGIHLKRDTL